MLNVLLFTHTQSHKKKNTILFACFHDDFSSVQNCMEWTPSFINTMITNKIYFTFDFGNGNQYFHFIWISFQFSNFQFDDIPFCINIKFKWFFGATSSKMHSSEIESILEFLYSTNHKIVNNQMNISMEEFPF